MTSLVVWIALGLLLWTAAQGLAAWYVVYRLRRPRRQFTKATVALRDHDLDR